MDRPGPKVGTIIRRYCDELAKMGLHVEKVFLYGSHAREQAREDSDVDLLIVSPDFVALSTRERLELLGVAAGRIWEPVEAIGRTPEELSRIEPASFLQEILMTGIPIDPILLAPSSQPYVALSSPPSDTDALAL